MENISLVLSGGGSRGSYQMGCWAALREMGLDTRINVVAGTSIGAINGALMVQQDYDRAMELWESIHPAVLFDIFREKNLSGKLPNWKLYYTLWKDYRNNGAVRFEQGKTLLRKLIREPAIKDSSIQFGLTTFNLDRRKGEGLFSHQIPDGLLADYIIASASLPIFRAHDIMGERYMDGGFYDNFPVGLALRQAPENPVICINISMKGSLATAALKQKYPKIRLEVLQPSKSLGSPLHFSSGTIQNNVNLGYEDTLKYFEQKSIKTLLNGT